LDESLLDWFNQNDIEYILHEHPAVFTVPEAKIHCGHIKGMHCKNLFLRDKKTDKFYLVTIPHDSRLDLKAFRKSIGSPKIRFGDPEDLKTILGVSPGAVSPLSIINDKEHKAIFMVDEDVWNAPIICAHPNINTETLQLSRENFHKILEITGHEVMVSKLPLLNSESNTED